MGITFSDLHSGHCLFDLFVQVNTLNFEEMLLKVQCWKNCW